jgi:hypothetical protein
MRRLTTFALVLALIGGVAGCGSSSKDGTGAPCGAGDVRSSLSHQCVRAGDPNFGETRSGEREHTPEEETAHNKSLELERRNKEQEADAQQKVNEAENEGGEHSIRRVEEKVCYESGKTSEECKGPLKETPEEERSEAENKARQQQGQEEETGKPTVVE